MRFCFAAFALIASAAAQDARPKDVREIGKRGSSAIAELTDLLKNPSTLVRVEAVKQLTAARALDALILATRDNEAEVQIQATDGLVNFYLPGYVQNGFGSSIMRVGSSIKGRFTDTNDQVVDPFVTARPDAIAALGGLVSGAASIPARANAARAVGILRGKAAVPDLLQALRTRDTDVLYESLIAMQKIRDESVGPQIAFLLRDLNSKVRIAAIETTGLLRNRAAVPDLIDVLRSAKDVKVRRAALGSLAMLPDPRSRAIQQQDLNAKDEQTHSAAPAGPPRGAAKSTSSTKTIRRRRCAAPRPKASRACAIRRTWGSSNRPGRTKARRRRGFPRSEERRVGKERRYRWLPQT